MNWLERILNYKKETGFPEAIHLCEDGRVTGTWVMGNNYKVNSGYYGGYPHGYLKRVRALFPDKKAPLHLFSGCVDQSAWPGDTVDLNSELNPTYVDDAQSLEKVPLENYDIVIADPPYSIEDCDHYVPTMIKRNKVMKALTRLNSGSHVVWLDQVLPMYRKEDWYVEAYIGMVKSTNHRFRVITVFRKL